jgi:hypothetical protein
MVPNFSLLQYLRMSWDSLKGFFFFFGAQIFKKFAKKVVKRKKKEKRKKEKSEFTKFDFVVLHGT